MGIPTKILTILNTAAVQPTSNLTFDWPNIALTTAIAVIGFLFNKWIGNVDDQAKSRDESLGKRIDDIGRELREKNTALVHSFKEEIEKLRTENETLKEDYKHLEEKFESISFKFLEKLQDMRIIIAEGGYTDKQ
jgi:hypothetical protein